MICYRAEIWCDGKNCVAGHNQGTAHDDHTCLPGLVKNIREMYEKRGWTFEGAKAYCPVCSRKAPKGKR